MLQTFCVKHNTESRSTYRPKHSIRTRVFVFSLLFTLCFALISTWAATRASRLSIIENNRHTAALTLTQSKRLIDDRFYTLLSQLITFTDDSSLRGVMLSLSKKPAESLQARNYINIDQSLNSIYSYNHQLLDSVVVYLNDGHAKFYKSTHGLFDVSFNFDQWYALYGNTNVHWLNHHPIDGVRDRGGERKVYSLFQLLGTPDSAVNGIVMFNISKEYFDNLLSTGSMQDHSYLALISQDGVSVFRKEGDELPAQLQNAVLTQAEPSGQLRLKMEDEYYHISYDTLATSHWRIASIMPEDELLSGVTEAQRTLLLEGLLLSLIFLIIATLFANQLVRPLRRLTSRISKVGTQSVTFDVRTDDEIGLLNDGLDHMMQRIDELNQRVRTESENKRIAEISILQAQIHPHFLYNTLYDIQQLCAMDDTATAAEMVEKLALFYRIGVSRGKKRIPLREELKHVESYLGIQHLRYPEVFEYTIDVPSELMEETVLKLTLQPLVENALYHGVKLRTEPGGQILISARNSGKELLLIVSDNGVGIPQEKLEALRAELNEAVFSENAFHSYGLRNVHNRLRLRWGETYGLTLESTEDEGCTVTAHLPLLSKREETSNG